MQFPIRSVSDVDGASPGPVVPVKRRRYLIFLGLLLLAQTLARVTLREPLGDETWFSVGLHIAIILAYLVAVVLIVSRLPERWRRYPVAGPTAVILMATGHAATTAFDIVQYAMQYYAAMDAPVWRVFSDPGMALWLLDSIGISLGELLLFLGVVLAAHLLLYFPAASQLAELARNLTRLRLFLGDGDRVSFAWLGLGYLGFFALLCHMVLPTTWQREIFHRGSIRSFQMAPPGLLTSAGELTEPMPPKATLPGARPLILIVVDALRTDRVGAYNPSGAPTPFLTGMHKAGELRLYPSYSTCTFSACGIMSILASRSWDDFGRRPPTIADALSRYSYKNYAMLAARDTLFGKFTELYGGDMKIRDLTGPGGSGFPNDDVMLRNLRAAEFPDPNHSFLYIHINSAHDAAYVRPKYRLTESERGARYESGRYREQYDLRVSQADEVLRDTFAILKDKGLLTNAFVIITADHGERLGERELYFHGGAADGAGTSTPLMIYDAARAPLADRPFTSSIDIAPTFLRAIGAAPLPGWRGHALQDAAWPGAVPLGTFENTGVVAALPGGTYRYICDRESGAEQIFRLDGSLEGAEMEGEAARAIFPQLRRLHSTIASPPMGKCRR